MADKPKGPSKADQVAQLRIQNAERYEKLAKKSSSTKTPSAPVKAWRDMTDAEREAFTIELKGGTPRPSKSLSAETQARIAKGKKQFGMTEAETSKPSSTAPVQASAPIQESIMAKKAKKAKKAVKKTAKKAATKKKVADTKAADGDSKTAQLLTMLQSPKGCTAAEACAALGWEQISIPPVVKRAGLKLRKEKEGRGIRYFATAA